MLLSLKHGAKILQHSAINRNVLLQRVAECSKPEFCDNLRHFAILCDLMETRLYTFVTDLKLYQYGADRVLISPKIDHRFGPFPKKIALKKSFITLKITYQTYTPVRN